MEFVHALRVAGERARQIEPETIDMHFRHPVTQTVHDQLERGRNKQIKRVPRASEIEI